jgi:hypothetical protein
MDIVCKVILISMIAIDELGQGRQRLNSDSLFGIRTFLTHSCRVDDILKSR